MGPLAGTRIVELAGIGPGPMAAMLLGDLGAEIIRVDRPVRGSMFGLDQKFQVFGRSKRSISVDLRKPGAAEVVLRIIETADGLIEPYRPGVAERLGLGPDVCLARNAKLLYGRITGWGQTGPLSKRAGHDINYIALTGVLDAIGRDGGRPVPPLNLVADFGGGGMLLAIGMLCGLIETMRSGRGQVIDAAMIDGSSTLFGMIAGLQAAGKWTKRGTNLLDGGAPFYDVYATKDGKHVAVGAIEGEFYRAFVEGLGLSVESLPEQMDRKSWPAVKERFATIFSTKTRDEWAELFADVDACVTPILTSAEAALHPQSQARDAYVEIDGVMQPAPAPRFSRTIPGNPTVSPPPGADTDIILTEAHFSQDEISQLRGAEIVS